MVCIIGYDSLILTEVFGMAFFICFFHAICQPSFIFLEIQAHLRCLFLHYLDAIIAEISLFNVPLVTFAICKRIILHGFICP